MSGSRGETQYETEPSNWAVIVVVELITGVVAVPVGNLGKR
jgi:hypothetical protein